MMWKVIAHCESKDDGKVKHFIRYIAAFNDPCHAQEFIEKCLPKESSSRFELIREE